MIINSNQSDNQGMNREDNMSNISEKIESKGVTNQGAKAQTSSLASVAARRPKESKPENMAGTGLVAKNVHAWFGSKHVLEDISMEFPRGTVTALIGPSGCGKSTFIRTLNRMHEFIPTAALAGEVLLDGKDVYQQELMLQRSDYRLVWCSKSQIHFHQ